jgi:hypothetical protein
MIFTATVVARKRLNIMLYAQARHGFLLITRMLLVSLISMPLATSQFWITYYSYMNTDRNHKPPKFWALIVVPIYFTTYKSDTGWTVRGFDPVGGEIFRTHPDRPWGPPSFLYNGYWVFPGGKAAGAWR